MPLNHTQYISVNNKQCMTQPTLINLHPNEYIQGLHYYLQWIQVDAGKVGILLMIYSIECIFQKNRKFKFKCFEYDSKNKLIININEIYLIQLWIVIQIKVGIAINVGVGVKIWKSIMHAKKDDIWNPATCTYEKGKYLASIINHFVIIYVMKL